MPKIVANIPVSGSLAEMGQAVKAVTAAFFTEVNSQGGIYNRRLKLKSIETAETPAATRANIERLLKDEHVFAMTAAFIAGIRGVAITGAQPVGVNATGQLGIRASSARYKEAIKSMDKASEVILSLRPVTFRYKNEVDPKGSPQFGLVAEQVATVDPDLVARDEQGKPFTVRYEEVNAMLLNEFLKEHSTVREQKASISRLQSAMAQQEREIQALAASLHKVNDQLALTKSTPRVVANSPRD